MVMMKTQLLGSLVQLEIHLGLTPILKYKWDSNEMSQTHSKAIPLFSQFHITIKWWNWAQINLKSGPGPRVILWVISHNKFYQNLTRMNLELSNEPSKNTSLIRPHKLTEWPRGAERRRTGFALRCVSTSRLSMRRLSIRSPTPTQSAFGPQLIGSLKLGNVWDFVQLIFFSSWPMNQLNKNINIA